MNILHEVRKSSFSKSRPQQRQSIFINLSCQPRHIRITLGNESNDDGTTTKEATATTEATATDMAISFPVPFLRDNYDSANESLQGGSSDRIIALIVSS
jgi:hypothetical protein